MGIAPYKTFTFDGESSADYGVYLTGEGVFNAPERAVEMLEIPGRNGNFALDEGRFENIEVTYKAGMFDVTEANFASKIEAFRNWLCSKVGYVRLSDDYNPNEYRMAVYSKGVKVDHDFLIAGEFEITFNCKPQRWLTSGETAVSVASGGTLTNPTLFDSSPLLEVKGYGNITITRSSEPYTHTIDLQNSVWGNVEMVSAQTSPMKNQSPNQGRLYWGRVYGTTIENKINTGDEITCGNIVFTLDLDDGGYTVESESSDLTLRYVATGASAQTLEATFTAVPTASCYSGTDGVFFQLTRRLFVKQGGSTIQTVTVTFTGEYKTASPSGYFTLVATLDHYDKISFYDASQTNTQVNITRAYIADSTKTFLGNPTYIDCDIGECYKIVGLQPVSLNDKIDLGSDLPKLSINNSRFNFDNTITELKVAPRWWKV